MSARGPVTAMRHRLIAAAGLIAASVSAPAQARDCHVPHFHFVENGETPVRMQVRRDAVCTLRLHISDSEAGDQGILTSAITERPKHGVLGRASVREFAYKPNERFVGADRFVIAIEYDRAGVQSKTTVTAAVEVTTKPLSKE